MIVLHDGLTDEADTLLRASWVASYARGRSDAHGRWDAPRCVVRCVWPSVIERVLSRCSIVRAEVDGVPDVTVAWLVHERGVVHYVWVADSLRRQGIARQLLDGRDVRASTHRTHDGDRLACALAWTGRYEPWRLLT